MVWFPFMCEMYAREHAYPLVLALVGMSGNLAQCVLLSYAVSKERKGEQKWL